MRTFDVLAIDLGASNGRGIIGRFDGDKLKLEETHRFQHESVQMGGHNYWNFLSIFDHVKTCIRKAAADTDIQSVGIDSWAQDYGLLDAQDNMLGLIHTYRDSRTANIQEKLLEAFSPMEIFKKTGTRHNPIATLIQLASMLEHEKATISSAKTFLFLADLINFFLTGYKGCNPTVASISLLYDPFNRCWQREMIDAMGLPDIFPELVLPGTMIGALKDDIAQELQCGRMDVCAITSHDTLSALDFIPDTDEKLLISSGTWSVLGCKIDEPDISAGAYDDIFLNELGYGNQFFLLRNITGMWIVQEVMREWRREGYEADFDALNPAALNSGYRGYIDVDRVEFASPGNMQQKVLDFLAQTSQSAPPGKAEIYKCILNGLALKYKKLIDRLEIISDKKFTSVHILGGGAKNTALNTMVASLCGVPVYAGPYESTAMGNVLCQLIAKKEIDASQASEIMKKSCEIRTVEPSEPGYITELYEVFRSAEK